MLIVNLCVCVLAVKSGPGVVHAGVAARLFHSFFFFSFHFFLRTFDDSHDEQASAVLAGVHRYLPTNLLGQVDRDRDSDGREGLWPVYSKSFFFFLSFCMYTLGSKLCSNKEKSSNVRIG